MVTMKPVEMLALKGNNMHVSNSNKNRWGDVKISNYFSLHWTYFDTFWR
jgi:hypothetical protein